MRAARAGKPYAAALSNAATPPSVALPHVNVKRFARAAPLMAFAQLYIHCEGMARNAAFSSLSLVPHWRPVPSSGAFFLGLPCQKPL